MRTKTFHLSGFKKDAGGRWSCAVPHLNKYAVQEPTRAIINSATYHEGADYDLDWEGEVFTWRRVQAAEGFDLDDTDDVRLLVTYADLIDLEAPFLWLPAGAARKAVAQYYSELSRCVDIGAWVSACLMAAAVCEGILAIQLGDNVSGFAKLIKKATKRKKKISASTADVMRRLNDARNTVHAGKVDRKNLSLPDRELALRASTLLERFINEKLIDR